MNPSDLHFRETHEWVGIEADDSGGQVATVGISAHAVELLTDLVYIELPQIGQAVTAGESFGEIESVKAVSDIYSPVTGEVVEVNEALPGSLETLGDDPYGAGWIAKIKVADGVSLDALLDEAAYQKLCAEEEH